MKGSGCFLSHSHLCSHSQSHSHSRLGLCLCSYIKQQQGAISAPEGYWQSLANVQPVTFWEPVLLPDISDPYSLLGHQLRTLRSAPGMITVEDCKTISCNFCTGACCHTWILWLLSSMEVSQLNSCCVSSLQGSEPSGRKGMASCYEMGAGAVVRAGRGCLSWPRGALGLQVGWCAQAYLLPLLLHHGCGWYPWTEGWEGQQYYQGCVSRATTILACAVWGYWAITAGSGLPDHGASWVPSLSLGIWVQQGRRMVRFIYASLAEDNSITAIMYHIAASAPPRCLILLQ